MLRVILVEIILIKLIFSTQVIVFELFTTFFFKIEVRMLVKTVVII